MSNEIYIVTGATGNIGKRIVEGLLAQKKKVRAVARKPEKLQALANLGAETVSASLTDTAAVAKAFAGASAVFAMIPPNPSSPAFRAYQNEVSQALADAVVKSGVRRVVSLSSVGAQHSQGVGPISGLYDHEQRFNQLAGVDVLHLRPSFFMENHLMGAGLMKKMGIHGTPIRGDLPIPMIATQDIARAALKAMLDSKFSGKSVQELLGERDLTMAEATRILSGAAGRKDVKYVQFPYEEAEKSLAGMGLSKDVAHLMVEMARAFNEGRVVPTEKRSAANTTPTSIEEFAKFFASVYSAN